MQAISTVYHGPTDTRGSRIVARCDAGRLTMPYDYAMADDYNHDAAALALARKLGWLEPREYAFDLISGTLASGARVYVFWHGGALGEIACSVDAAPRKVGV